MTVLSFDPHFVQEVQAVVMARDGKNERADEIRFRCPSHSPDAHPSARFNTSKLTWRCDVCGAGGGVFDLADRLNIARPSRSQSLGASSVTLARTDSTPRVEEATYDYLDESGTLLYQVIRYQPKDFRQRAPDGNGGWKWKLDGVRRVLYKLPEVQSLAAAGWRVFVVEGEKDADRLEALGLCATTSPHGAGKWRDEYAEMLRGADVVVIPDRDKIGKDHAATIAASCHGKAKSVRLLDLPNDAKDVSEWLEAGGTKADLERLADGAAAYALETAPLDRTRAMSGPDFLALDIPEQKWLVTGHLPEQSIGWIVGLPKVFKSFYAMELGFSVASGSAFLGRFDAGAPLNERRVLLVQFESSLPSFQTRVRSMATRYGTIPSSIFFLSNVPVILEDEASRERIERELEQIRPELLILDPLAAMTTGDENSATEMGVVVRTLRGWRDTYGCAIVTVHHANKTKQEGNGRAGLKMRGSTALYGSSEATISIERPDDDENRVHVRVEVKDGESPKPYVCEFNPVGSDLQVTSDSIRRTISDDDLYGALPANGNRIPQAELAAILETSTKTIRSRMGALIQAERVGIMGGQGSSVSYHRKKSA